MKFKILFVLPLVMLAAMLKVRSYYASFGTDVAVGLGPVSPVFVGTDTLIVPQRYLALERVELQQGRLLQRRQWWARGQEVAFALPRHGFLNAYSPFDANHGVAATTSGTYLLSHNESGGIRQSLDPKGWSCGVAIEPRQKLIFGGGQPTVWKWANGKVRQLWRKPIASLSPSASAAFSPDGTLLAVGSYNGSVTVFASLTGKKLWASPPVPPRSTKGLGHWPNDPLGTSGSVVYDGIPGDETFYFPLCFIPKSKRILYSNIAGTFVRDAKNGKLIHHFASPLSWCYAVAASPDGKTVAVSVGGTVDGGIQLRDAGTGELRRKLRGSHRVHWLSFSPDGNYLAGAQEIGLKIWEVN